jgi:complex iron-sulfur molybdoenzyme family reductase subunit gamma
LTEIKDGSASSSMMMSRIPGYGWIATIVRPLNDDYAKLGTTAPVAIAIWDGNKNNRNGLKVLSGWNAVVITKEDAPLIDSLTKTVKGDIVNGKAEAMNNCASCHRYTGADSAPEYMAPDLSNIGGYATADYIKESIEDPSAVVVPGYNQNAHSNSPWYYVTDGKRESAMPPLGLDEKTVTDIVAFMQTLKTSVTNVKGK